MAFPGQGGDWRAALVEIGAQPAHPLVRALADRLGTDRWDDLDGLDTRNAQPVIYVAGLVGPARALVPGTDASLALGHSLGEITAATWAGAFDPIAGLDLMVARGRLGHERHAFRPGAMAAINRWGRERVDRLRTEVLAADDGVLDVAVVNSPTQIVVSGDEALVQAAIARANDEGAVARRLPIGGGYHSALMADAVDAFRERIATALTGTPKVPVLSSTLHRPLRAPDELADGLARSLVLAVDWPATVAAANALGAIEAVEAGPGDTLGRLARFVPDLAIVAP